MGETRQRDGQNTLRVGWIELKIKTGRRFSFAVAGR